LRFKGSKYIFNKVKH